MIGDYYNVKTITMFEVIYVFIAGRNRSEQLLFFLPNPDIRLAIILDPC